MYIKDSQGAPQENTGTGFYQPKARSAPSGHIRRAVPTPEGLHAYTRLTVRIKVAIRLIVVQSYHGLHSFKLNNGETVSAKFYESITM